MMDYTSTADLNSILLFEDNNDNKRIMAVEITAETEDEAIIKSAQAIYGCAKG